MFFGLLICSVSLAFAQVPLYLRTPAIATPVISAAPVAQLQCAQQCMPSCLPSCLVGQSPTVAYQQYPQYIQSPQVPVASAYDPYGANLAYYPIVPSCTPACMPTCAPTCVATPSSPQRDDLPTPPPETMPTPPPEEATTTSTPDVVPCSCLIKITVTQGNKVISKCGPNSCACPQKYKQCGSNCCRA
uniref:Uncharacterized protein n=1 Tax=Caenorhabditis japonica TaxID=281687 RepID=A0A8R1IBC8_CAEJA